MYFYYIQKADKLMRNEKNAKEGLDAILLNVYVYYYWISENFYYYILCLKNQVDDGINQPCFYLWLRENEIGLNAVN